MSWLVTSKVLLIEIGGDTQPLQRALKGINKGYESTKELKQIDRALKFDTGNVTSNTKSKRCFKQIG